MDVSAGSRVHLLTPPRCATTCGHRTVSGTGLRQRTVHATTCTGGSAQVTPLCRSMKCRSGAVQLPSLCQCTAHTALTLQKPRAFYWKRSLPDPAYDWLGQRTMHSADSSSAPRCAPIWSTSRKRGATATRPRVMARGPSTALARHVKSRMIPCAMPSTSRDDKPCAAVGIVMLGVQGLRMAGCSQRQCTDQNISGSALRNGTCVSKTSSLQYTAASGL